MEMQELRLIRTTILATSGILIVLGILNGDYDLVRAFVRFICISCLGLGG